jgi:hypothetical protein
LTPIDFEIIQSANRMMIEGNIIIAKHRIGGQRMAALFDGQ